MQELTEEKLYGIFFNEDHEKIVKSDFAIVLGGTAESCLARAKAAAHFYREGGTDKLIVSGGVCHEVDGEQIAECEFLKKLLIENGVPESAIIKEPRATDTVENIVCSLAEICRATEVLSVRRVTVVTEAYHMPRALLTAKVFLPPFITVFGYTEGAGMRRNEILTNDALKNSYARELKIMEMLAAKTGIPMTALYEIMQGGGDIRAFAELMKSI